jgi:hypothetical protein
MGLTMFVSSKMTQTDPKMAAMTYVMPVVLTFVFLNSGRARALLHGIERAHVRAAVGSAQGRGGAAPGGSSAREGLTCRRLPAGTRRATLEHELRKRYEIERIRAA